MLTGHKLIIYYTIRFYKLLIKKIDIIMLIVKDHVFERPQMKYLIDYYSSLQLIYPHQKHQEYILNVKNTNTYSHIPTPYVPNIITYMREI